MAREASRRMGESSRSRALCRAISKGKAECHRQQEEGGELESPESPVSKKRNHERTCQPSNVRIDERDRRPGWLGGDEQPGMQRLETRKAVLREPTQRSANLMLRHDSPEGRCGPALSIRTAVLPALTKVPRVSGAVQQNTTETHQ